MSAVEDSLETQARIGALRCEGGPHSPTGHLLRQLADEIERLRAEAAALKEEHHFQACLTRDLLPYQERAVKAEAEIDRLRAVIAFTTQERNAYQDATDVACEERDRLRELLNEAWPYVGENLQGRIDAALGGEESNG